MSTRLNFDISPETVRQLDSLRPKSPSRRLIEDMQELALRRLIEEETDKPKAYILGEIELKNRAAMESEILEKIQPFPTPTEEVRHLLNSIDELRSELLRRGRTSTAPICVFISHAGEDKDDVARPLAEGLQRLHIRVWFDEYSLKIGDSIWEGIERGLSLGKLTLAWSYYHLPF
jgi:hypothetical protein